MAEYSSPLTKVINPGLQGGLSGYSGVTLCEKTVGGLVQIVGWEGFEIVLAKVFGLTKSLHFGTARNSGDFTLFLIAPTRVQVHHPDTSVLLELADGIDTTQVGFVDLSHARCRLRLSGPDVENVLHRLAALDFKISAFPVGDFRQSGIHHIATLFHRTGDQEFDLFIPTTWAVSIFEYLHDAALSYGINIVKNATDQET